jgi:hypothetical protein
VAGRWDFAAACFLAAASAGATEAVGRGDSNRALSPGADGGKRAAACPTGSGVMMLTAGVEAAVGNSALVGLPVGTPGGSAATGPGERAVADVGAGGAAGKFQDGA